MPKKVDPIPQEYNSLTPYLTVQGADKAIEFYKRAFGAQELCRMPGAGGKIMHAELKVGDSVLMLADEFPETGGLSSPKTLKGSCVTIHLYVENVDGVFKQALAAGAKARMQPADMFWGDRYGKLTDPFGHEWSLATHKEDLTPQEIDKRAEAFFAQSARK